MANCLNYHVTQSGKCALRFFEQLQYFLLVDVIEVVYLLRIFSAKWREGSSFLPNVYVDTSAKKVVPHFNSLFSHLVSCNSLFTK
jgi:hypothetical protein